MNGDNHTIIKAGSKVIVDWDGCGNWYTGNVYELNKDGSVNINFDDGDTAENISMAVIKLSPFPDSLSQRSIHVGCAVLALWQGNGNLYPAIIMKDNNDGTFDIRYDDEEICYGVCERYFELRLSNGWFQGSSADGKVRSYSPSPQYSSLMHFRCP